MTEKPKTPDVTTIIEIVDRIDWRWVVLAGALGAVAVFVLLAAIEHAPDAPSFLPDGED